MISKWLTACSSAWRQENFFQIHARGVSSGCARGLSHRAGGSTRTIPNPERRALDKQIARRAPSCRNAGRRQYGAAAADNGEQHRPFTMLRLQDRLRQRIGKQLRAARERLNQLIDPVNAATSPSRVEIKDLSEQAVVKLATERKHLTDIIKMLAYQAESDLLNLLRPRYQRAEQEGRRRCSTSCSPSLATSKSPTASYKSPWPRSAPRIERVFRALPLRASRPDRHSVPGLSSSCSLRRASAAVHQPCFPWYTAPPRHCLTRGPSPLSAPKPDIFKRGYVRRSEFKPG